MDTNQSEATPTTRPGYSCIACKRPDSADDIVACHKCSLFWHYTCAGVSDSMEHLEWTCSRCRLVSTTARSVRSTTSSRRAMLQVKRLAEQQELERKQLELEKKQLELQKKHSQEKFDLEESLAEEEDNRSVRSRVIEIESREKQVSTWVDQHTAEVHQQVDHSSNPVAAHTGFPQLMQSNNSDPENVQQEEEGAVGGEDSSSQPDPLQNIMSIGGGSPDQAVLAGLHELQEQLGKCQQQSKPTIEQKQKLEAQLKRFLIQLQHAKPVYSTRTSCPEHI